MDPGDDFKRIEGIGLAIERRLHSAGVYTFEQLAAYSPAELATILAGTGVSVSKIEQKGWLNKAAELASPKHESLDESTKHEPLDESAKHESLEETELVYHQHNASFTLRLVINDENQVRYTEAQHVQSESKKSWAGWDESAFVTFVSEHSGLALPAPPTVAQEELSSVTPLHMAITDIELREADIGSASEKRSITRQLIADIFFALDGDAARSVTVKEPSVSTQVLVRDFATNKISVLGSADGHLRADALDATTTVTFDLPAAGRYQVFGVVSLLDAAISAVKPGPVFRVVP